MADLAVTANNVKYFPASDAEESQRIAVGRCGETITRGMPLYLDASTNPAKWKKAQANDTLGEFGVDGYSLSDAVLDQWIAVLVNSGSGLADFVALDLGAGVLGEGTEYFLSQNNAGKIAPRVDIAGADNYVQRLGIVAADGRFHWMPDATGVRLP